MKTIYCKKCGAETSKDASFCGNCGEKISLAAIAKNNCPSCGYVTNEDEKYCPECGTALTLGNEVGKTPKTQTKPAEKMKPQPAAKTTITPPVKKKKGGFFRTLGKVALWTLGILIVAVIGLYFIGDSPDENNTTESELKTETPIKVREANPVLTNKVAFTVINSSKVQEFNYQDSIKISLPPNFISKTQSLAVSKVEVDKSILVDDLVPLKLIDVTLEGEKQPSQPIEVSFSYYQNKLNPNYGPEEQLYAFRWDEENGTWLNLATRIDIENKKVFVLVDHFSILGFFVLPIKIVSTAVAVGVSATTVGERLLNDVYITPKKNFRILYSKKMINNDKDLKDTAWKIKGVKKPGKYINNHPRFIQDVGYFLESALKRYTDVYHFKNPAWERKGLLGLSYQKSIIVKMDSYWTLKNPFSAADPSYEKIFQRIHIPSKVCKSVLDAKLNLSHELFHAIQAQYYSVLGSQKFLCNTWWLEATAEYASYYLAWKTPFSGMEKGMSPKYLTYPVNSRGLKNGYIRDHEYQTSFWIKYLVDNGMDFKQMIEYDASDYRCPLVSLKKNIDQQLHKRVEDVYRDFANWMVFSKNGGLNNQLIGNFGKTKYTVIDAQSSILSLGSGKEINYSFDLPDHYSSKLWAIKVTKAPLDKRNDIKPILIKLKSKTARIAIDVFVLAQGERFLTPPKPIKSIYTKDKPVMVFAKPNDLILVTATQGSESGGNAEVIVSDVGIILEIDPAELPNVRPREANDFTITAKNIPKEIENVSFEWDYSDGSEKGIRDFVTVSNGEAKQKISHRYKESDKEEIYPLKVILKEAGKNTILSEAEALVTLPLAKPVLSVTPGIAVGPPGETFDMEAKAYPRNTYKFVWEISGFGETFTQEGEMSGIAPIIDEEGEYSVTVKLYDLAGNYLNKTLASISVEPDELDTEGVDGIVGIDEDENLEPFTHSGYWVLYDTKEINGCPFYESKCWPLEKCAGSPGSFSMAKGYSTCGNEKIAGATGSGTYTVPPSKLVPGETIRFTAAGIGSSYPRVDVYHYDDINKMSFDEYGNNTGQSPSSRSKIVGCYSDSSPCTGEYRVDFAKENGAIMISGGGGLGSPQSSVYYLFLYKWQK